MDLSADSVIAKHRADLIEGMRGFMKHAGYDESDIAQCDAILAKFLDGMTNAPDHTSGMQLVKETCFALNELNERCGHELIETMEREFIAEILIRAGHLRGFNAADDDITLEWREW